MSDQGITAPGLLDPPLEEDARRLEAERPASVDDELDAALALIRGAVVTLRAAGDHLRMAAAGLPEIPLSDAQTLRRGALLVGAASALHELDKALDASGA